MVQNQPNKIVSYVIVLILKHLRKGNKPRRRRRKIRSEKMGIKDFLESPGMFTDVNKVVSYASNRGREAEEPKQWSE